MFLTKNKSVCLRISIHPFYLCSWCFPKTAHLTNRQETFTELVPSVNLMHRPDERVRLSQHSEVRVVFTHRRTWDCSPGDSLQRRGSSQEQNLVFVCFQCTKCPQTKQQPLIYIYNVLFKYGDIVIRNFSFLASPYCYLLQEMRRFCNQFLATVC